MLREISLAQFLEWMAYAELEPFGERREDYRAASVVQAIWNSARWEHSSKQHPYQEIPIESFRLKFGEEDAPPKPKQTWQEQLAIAKLWVAAYNTPEK